MTQERASKLIMENLNAIYGFAYGRLYEKDKVEDLASEIVCEILTSVKNLEKEEAFWGFAWRIAENTFRKFIKREELRGRTEAHSEEEYMGNYIPAPETEYLEEEEQEEQIYLLRRELSLLSNTHREVCVAYYVDNKSCGQIALLSEFRGLDFAGNGFDDNRLLFAMLNIAMVNAFQMTKKKSPLGKMPKLALGGNGWVFGCDNDYVHYHFNGVTMETWNQAGTAWFSAENYKVIEGCQRYSHNNFGERAEAMCRAVLNGRTRAGFCRCFFKSINGSVYGPHMKSVFYRTWTENYSLSFASSSIESNISSMSSNFPSMSSA